MLNYVAVTGIKEDLCMDTLKYFQVTDNVGLGMMHDAFEGVASLEVKLLHQHLHLRRKTVVS